MKKRIIISFIGCLFSVLIGTILYLLFNDFLLMALVMALGIFFSIRKIFIDIVSRLIKSTNGYKYYFPDAHKFQQLQQHLDLINLGSNSARFALDYSNCGIRAANLAVSPQTIWYDFQVFKNYHSYMKDGGVLLLVLCPFSFCKDFYTSKDGIVSKDIRYYPFMHRAMIRNFDQKIYHKWVENPILIEWKAWLRILWNPSPVSKQFEITNCPLTHEQMEVDASSRINGWKKEFEITNFEDPNYPDHVNQALIFTKDVFNQLITFAKERNYSPVVIVPPVSTVLNALIPESFKQNCFYNQIPKDDILLFDYMTDLQFAKNEYFLNSLYLNKSGRLKFTELLIGDLSREGLL